MTEAYFAKLLSGSDGREPVRSRLAYEVHALRAGCGAQ